MTDPSLTKITNGSHHGHSSGIGTCKPDKWTPEKHSLGLTHILRVTCMFNHAVALSHALLFPTLGAHWQSLDLRIFQVKYAELQNSHSHRSSRRLGSSASSRTCRTPLWSCKACVGFKGDHLFEMVKVILPYATCQCEVHAVQQSLSLSNFSFSPSVTAVHGTVVPFSYVEMILPLPPQTYFFLSGFHFVVLFPLTSLLFRHL